MNHTTPPGPARRIAIIIPACNEAAALDLVLPELRAALAQQADPGRYLIALGANGCADATAEVARRHDAVVGKTAVRAYGHGCVAAITAALEVEPEIAAYLFFSADGANDPAEIPLLVRAWEEGTALVLGSRTDRPGNYASRFGVRRVSNLVLAGWCSLLAGRVYRDLGPYRIIDRALYERMAMRELTWGWTIEPQIRAARLGASIREVPVAERPRVAGEQKVSGVSLRHSLRIGWAILQAGWRVRFGIKPPPESGRR